MRMIQCVLLWNISLYLFFNHKKQNGRVEKFVAQLILYGIYYLEQQGDGDRKTEIEMYATVFWSSTCIYISQYIGKIGIGTPS